MTSSCICLACRREQFTHARKSNTSTSLLFILRCTWHARINMPSKTRSDGGGGIVLIPGTTVVTSPHINERYYHEARERSEHILPWLSKKEKASLWRVGRAQGIKKKKENIFPYRVCVLACLCGWVCDSTSCK